MNVKGLVVKGLMSFYFYLDRGYVDGLFWVLLLFY